MPNIAFEIDDHQIILYQKKKKTIILLNHISKIRLCDHGLSFDGYLWEKNKKTRLHYFIKNKKEVLNELESLVKKHGIQIEYYTTLIH